MSTLAFAILDPCGNPMPEAIGESVDRAWVEP